MYIQTIQVKLYFKVLLNITSKKGLLSAALFLFFYTPLSALSYYSYDFRDINSSLNFTSHAEAYSDNLPFNTFDEEWIEPPSHEKKNNAFGEIYNDFYVDYDGFKLGVFKQGVAQISMNDGFIQTWHSAEKDFTKLLSMDNINQKLPTTSIEGEATYSDVTVCLYKKLLISITIIFSVLD